ncbi:SGNH/GDSL hydrolase family protein [Peribacillus phoenicis]|uniref:SGNH/GDSL hydrolase family protein n=1 Tax=unclassified Peribacillus TaxID=2675266 RepID=UPI0039A22849
MTDVNVNFPPTVSPNRSVTASDVESMVTQVKADVEGQVSDVTAQLAETGISPSQLGAKVDGVSDDTSFINEAISTGKKLVGYGTTIVSSLTDPYSLKSEDSLKVIRKSDGYLYNSYADKYNRIIFGREYLSYFHRRIALGSGVKVLFSGDSTTANLGLIEDYRIHNLIKKLATYDGFYNVNTVNRGQSGKTSSEWMSTYLSGDIAENADLIVLRWGINDPEKGGNLETFLGNMKAGLTQFRNNKTYSQQSIIPNDA